MQAPANHFCVIGPRDTPPEGYTVLNVTSRANDWAQAFSPFRLGPVTLYDGHTARNVENAWQFSKVYSEHLGHDGAPTSDWWLWAKAGWANAKAQRYPMGKGRVPVFSWWAGEKLGVVPAPAHLPAAVRECGAEDRSFRHTA